MFVYESEALAAALSDMMGALTVAAAGDLPRVLSSACCSERSVSMSMLS